MTDAQLQPIIAEAIARWSKAGLTAAEIHTLSQVQFVVSDLPGWYLGEADGGQVFIDANAAGHGWFVDLTPAADNEFVPTKGNRNLTAVDPRAT